MADVDGFGYALLLTDHADGPGGIEGYSQELGGGGGIPVALYFKMRAQDSGVAPPGYVTWVASGSPDFIGAGYAGGSPAPIGPMVAGSTVVAARWEG